MPTTNANGINLYYEVYGQGEPLLLIMGLSLNSKSWFRTLPALSEHYQVIIFDNRGVGLSDKPNTPYSIELMAEDARAVLDAAGVETAHVYGISMGGMIAQKLAIKYPERIRSLILGCTTSGGVNHVQPGADVSLLMLSNGPSLSTRNPPNFGSGIGAFSAADMPSASTRRVSAGSITPSSQIRALE